MKQSGIEPLTRLYCSVWWAHVHFCHVTMTLVEIYVTMKLAEVLTLPHSTAKNTCIAFFPYKEIFHTQCLQRKWWKLCPVKTQHKIKTFISSQLYPKPPKKLWINILNNRDKRYRYLHAVLGTCIFYLWMSIPNLAIFCFDLSFSWKSGAVNVSENINKGQIKLPFFS